MLSPTRFSLVLLASALFGGALWADDDIDAEPSPEQIAEIRQNIRNLDADSFETREAASRQLWLIGPPAIPLLQEIARQANPEVRYRAQLLLRSIPRSPLRAAIVAFCDQPEETLDVERGMVLISQILNPNVRQADVDRQLDTIAGRVREKLGKEVDPATADPQQVVTALREVLFDDCTFTGNKDDYNNPYNSSIERVLTTRKGLPILLAHVTVAVARRLDVPIVGLPVSGMYTVKYDGSRAPKGFPKQDIFFHPYEGGRVLSREDRQKLFPGEDPDKLVPTGTAREVLVRMLSNLTSALDHKGEQEAEQLQLANEMKLRLQKGVGR